LEIEMTTIENFDTRQLRNVLGRFFTGVTVVTTIDQTGKTLGVTANSFTSVSLDPPLILWNQAIASPSHPVFRGAERFAINILAEDQVSVSQRFSRPCPNRFEGLPVSRGLGNIPLIDGCCAVLECRKIVTHAGGDHAMFIGQVERVSSNDRRPLIFGDGTYLKAHPFEMVA
jgi:flavin reductase (DIM6/NTAB) family NADH-FMN oxidoreductase RutF